jgi:hypothetical protein
MPAHEKSSEKIFENSSVIAEEFFFQIIKLLVFHLYILSILLIPK